MHSSRARTGAQRGNRLSPLLILSLLLLAVPLSGEAPIVVAVPAGENGLQMLNQWQRLAAYIGSAGGLSVRLEVTPDNPAVLRGLANNRYDFAFLDPAWCVIGMQRGILEPLAVARIGGHDSFRSLLVVHEDSIIREPAHIGSGPIALTVPYESAAGYYVPMSLLRENGLSIDRQDLFVFAGTFASVLKGVAYGRLPAGFVPSTLLDAEEYRELRTHLRVVLASLPLPNGAVVSRCSLPHRTAEVVSALLLSADGVEQGREALAAGGFSGFTAAGAEDFRIIGAYYRSVEDTLAPTE